MLLKQVGSRESGLDSKAIASQKLDHPFPRNRDCVSALIGASQFRPFRLTFHGAVEIYFFERLCDQRQIDDPSTDRHLAISKTALLSAKSSAAATPPVVSIHGSG